MLPPLVASPSVAYHCRSTGVIGTPAGLQPGNVVPWSSERPKLKFASVKSAKYRCPPVSTASSVSPPPGQAVTLPVLGIASVTHLTACARSAECQIQPVWAERDPAPPG